jgi:hypothetical protein
MTLDQLGNIGEFVGAIAVVATLVYLARQIRHSAEATRIAAYHQATQQLWSGSIALSTDPGLAEIMAKAFEEGIDGLALPDRIRLEMTLTSLFFGAESLLALHEKGLIYAELWQNWFENSLQLLGSRPCKEYLATRPGSISRRLETLINEHLEGDDRTQ